MPRVTTVMPEEQAQGLQQKQWTLVLSQWPSRMHHLIDKLLQRGIWHLHTLLRKSMLFCPNGSANECKVSVLLVTVYVCGISVSCAGVIGVSEHITYTCLSTEIQSSSRLNHQAPHAKQVSYLRSQPWCSFLYVFLDSFSQPLLPVGTRHRASRKSWCCVSHSIQLDASLLLINCDPPHQATSEVNVDFQREMTQWQRGYHYFFNWLLCVCVSNISNKNKIMEGV